MRLIDADKVEGKLRNIIPKIENLKNVIPEADMFGFGVVRGIKKAVNELLDAPNIEAEPVRHGKWIKFHDELSKCSLCNYPTYTRWNQTDYCPNCGAKMEGKNEDGVD